MSDPAWHSRVARGFARGAVAANYVENIRRYYKILSWLSARHFDNPAPEASPYEVIQAG